jgi:ABC-2 type transport system ATP-binding protein
LLKFIEPFYPTWDRDLARSLQERFELPPKTRVKRLSKGQGVRLGLLLALAHRPELVVLDDPTLGLDPIMRKEFLRDVVEHLQGRGVTVFFSSHLLYEIEPVADQVAILDRGRIVRQCPTERLREEVKQLILPVAIYDRAKPIAGALDVKRWGGRVSVVVENAPAVLGDLRSGAVKPEVVDLNLDEIFEAYVIGRRGEGHDKEPGVERVA